jgi:hypothetical protein
MKPLYLSHTVTSKAETWRKVSEWYTGSSKNWQKLLDYNPDLNKKRLDVGNVVLIPMELVKNNSPFVMSPPPKVKPKPKAPVTKKKRPNEEFALPPEIRTVETPTAIPTLQPTETAPPVPTVAPPSEVAEPPAPSPSSPLPSEPTTAPPTPSSAQPPIDGVPDGGMEALLEEERKALEKLQMEVLGGQKGNDR